MRDRDEHGPFKELLRGDWHLLPEEEKQAYVMRARSGDARALEAVVRCYAKWVLKRAFRFSRIAIGRFNVTDRDSIIEDLFSEGFSGVFKAIERFDPKRGNTFSTYATWWIDHAMERYLNNKVRTIRIPVHMETRLAEARKAGKFSASELHALGMAQVGSLDAPRRGKGGEDRDEAVWSGVDEGSASPEDDADTSQVMSLLRHLLTDCGPWDDCLPEPLNLNEQKVLLLRFFGTDEDKKPMTLEEAGEQLELTRERARQIQAEGLYKLRKSAQLRELAVASGWRVPQDL